MNHPNHLIHLNAHGISSDLQAAVHTNTFLITPVVHFYPEFFDFCDCVYKHKPSPRHLSSEKVYRFMFYLSFREKSLPEECWVVVVSDGLIEMNMIE
jgi:hypothetical protein